ncbi:DUF7310 family coiled-coil domain-containing protein [Halobacterium jilantaiense]|uniref:DUF7310 domain-containing protein n=1 Tax=Halobacterium jilantaiense TaxID=355548 RepID=A0A1I0P1G0_9EURY|nr:hypothetical protein [Halobacterium jilantaiense]SEW07311.1 hypothetical protein SAMN04487945_1276 [Halobacterium jilantaiense]
MTDNSLEARVAAVERALTDGDTAVDLSDPAERQRHLDALADDLDTLTERVDALEATVQSLHGYVGEIEHVNDRVERRADAARAAVERLDDEARAHAPEPDRSSPERAPSTGDETAVPDSAARLADSDEKPASLLDRLRSSL